MSVVSNIQRILSVAPLRSRTRRARQSHFSQGRKTDINFIITRADLLAPRKEQVDRLMPLLVQILRDALGRAARSVRLGNVRCVSAKRGWWTKQVKADVWKRGGGGWMVGKVNVGKSNLFEVIFPKGRQQDVNLDQFKARARILQPNKSTPLHVAKSTEPNLLPPPRSETAYPIMPTVSSLPGTTASPIRIPFGNGKGELIDLPGLERSTIGAFIREEEQENIMMKARITPEQYTLSPGSSLLLNDLIRITPVNQDITFLAYPFTSMHAHMTRTQKANEVQEGIRAPVSSFAKEGIGGSLKSAGIFQLDTDVTKSRAGPLVRKDAVGLKPTTLPFKVLATDILIESVGWIELVAQVRRKDFPDGNESYTQAAFPAVEVFSPEGRFVASRRSLSAITGASKAANMVNVLKRMRRLKELLDVRLGPGAMVMNPEVKRIHMQFAKKIDNGHMGPRSAACTK
ncbi:MAG: hypothetical protein Q9162_006252 [Coniocarpon cinnabarinum]